jgi:cytidine deaminase
MPERLDRGPVTKFEKTASFELWNIEDLPEQERLAVLDAKAAYKNSTNAEFRAGACAVAGNGEKVVKHNHTNEPGKGQKGHAEMLALRGLFATVNPAERKLKILALAASYPDQSLARGGPKYSSKTKFNNIHDIDAPHICGRCLKMMSDFSGNNVPYSAETGARIKPPDPVVLILTRTNQVVRTTLSTLYPSPHVPHRVETRPWEDLDTNVAPDSYSAK